MTTSRKPGNKATVEFSQETVQKVGAVLEEMAKQPRGVTLFEIIREYELQIRESLKNGYSAEDICAAMKKLGVPCSPNTLKKYLIQARKEREGGKTGESSLLATDSVVDSTDSVAEEIPLSTEIEPGTTETSIKSISRAY